MSSTVLYGITKEFKGEEIANYKNSWLFNPCVWWVLQEKYLGNKDPLMRNETFKECNNLLNESSNTSDRILWELSNEQIFFAKDTETIAKAIKNFLAENKEYGIGDDGKGILTQDHIIERFNEIANDMLTNKDKYEYFVVQGTTVSGRVEGWFIDYENDCECPLKPDSDAEFVVIENEEITYIALADEVVLNRE